jgi:hypothetical protein
MERKSIDDLRVGIVGAPATFEETVPENRTKKTTDAGGTTGSQQEEIT